MERASKLQKLHSFRKALPSMSKTALAAVLHEVQQHGPPELSTTGAMVEAQRLELAKHNAFGELIFSQEFITSADSAVELLVVNPLSYLHGAVQQGGSMTELMLKTLDAYCCDAMHPLNVIFYADEVCPGNPLATRLDRKAWLFYVSFLEFGPALANTSAWLVVGVQRSD